MLFGRRERKNQKRNVWNLIFGSNIQDKYRQVLFCLAENSLASLNINVLLTAYFLLQLMKNPKIDYYDRFFAIIANFYFKELGLSPLGNASHQDFHYCLFL